MVFLSLFLALSPMLAPVPLVDSTRSWDYMWAWWRCQPAMPHAHLPSAHLCSDNNVENRKIEF